MSNIEREAGLPQETTQKDTLTDLKNKAKTIETLLTATNSYAQITVLGALHVGILGDDIYEQILKSDVVTLELPADVARQGQ